MSGKRDINGLFVYREEDQIVLQDVVTGQTVTFHWPRALDVIQLISSEASLYPQPDPQPFP